MFKYKVGDVVHCFREETDSYIGFDFTGEILHRNNTGIGIEYVITNAPLLFEGREDRCLIWESEIISKVEKENI